MVTFSGVVEWRELVAAFIDFVREHYDEDLGLDYDPESLVALGEWVVWRYPTVESMEVSAEEWVVAGSMGYLGEMLLRVGGGGWRELPHSVYQGVPGVVSDPALGLTAAPSELVRSAVRERREGVLAEVFDEWRRAADAYRVGHPSWMPVKEPTPRLDAEPTGPDEADARYLRDWLAAREAAFPQWVATYGAGVAWDFSAEPLVPLGALVARLTPTAEALHDPGNAEFVDGASWYLGETLRRIKGGDWYFEAGDPEEDVYGGLPYIRQPAPHDWASVPFSDLEMLIEEEDPHYLRTRYDQFAE